MLTVLTALCVGQGGLPDGALARVGSPAFRFPGSVREATYSPDGKFVAAVGPSRAGVRHGRVWRADTGRPVAGIDLSADFGADVEFGDGGRFLYAVRGVDRNGATVVLERLDWDGSHKEVFSRRLSRRPSGVWGTFVGPKRMVVIVGGEVLFLDVPTGKPAATWRAGVAQSLSATCPRGRLIAVEPARGGGQVQVLDAVKGEPVFAFAPPAGADVVTFSPDGRWLLARPEGDPAARTVALYDLKAKKQSATFEGGGANATEALFPDGRVALLRGGDVTVHAPDGKRQASFNIDQGVRSAWATPDGRRLLAWAPATPKAVGRLLIIDPATGKIRHAVEADAAAMVEMPADRQPGPFRPDGKAFLVKRFDGGGLKEIDLEAGRVKAGRDGVGDVSQLRFLDDKRLALFGPRRINIVDWKTGRRDARDELPVTSWPSTLGDVAGPRIAHLVGNQIAVGRVGDDPLIARRLPLWGQAGVPVLFVRRLAFGDRRLFVTVYRRGTRLGGGAGQVKSLGVWERPWSDEPSFRTLSAAANYKGELTPSPGGRYVFEAESGKPPKLHDTRRGKVTTVSLQFASASQVKMAFLPGDRLAVMAGRAGDTGLMCLVECPTGAVAAGPYLYSGASGLTVSPGGRTAAYFDGNNALILQDVITGESLARYAGHTGPSRVAFSPSGRLVATSDRVAPVFVWGVPRPKSGEKLTAADLADCWRDLASDDPKAAFKAMRRLTGDAGRAVPFLVGRLNALARGPNLADARRLVAGLDADAAADRRAATAELLKLNTPAVRSLLAESLRGASPEAARRIRKVVAAWAKIDPVVPRDRRALQVIEWAGGRVAANGLRSLKRADLGDAVAATLRRIEQAR